MKVNNRGRIAIGEIMILLGGIFAFTWMIGGVYGIEDGDSSPRLATHTNFQGGTRWYYQVELYPVHSIKRWNSETNAWEEKDYNNYAYSISNGNLVPINEMPSPQQPAATPLPVDEGVGANTEGGNAAQSIGASAIIPGSSGAFLSMVGCIACPEGTTSVITHTIQPGDTYGKIAAGIDGVSAEDLMELNPTLRGDTLPRGVQMTIPIDPDNLQMVTSPQIRKSIMNSLGELSEPLDSAGLLGQDFGEITSAIAIKDGGYLVGNADGEFGKIDAEKATKLGFPSAEVVEGTSIPRTRWTNTKSASMAVLKNFGVAMTIVGGFGWLGNAIFPDHAKEVKAISQSLGAGYFAGKTAVDFFGSEGIWKEGGSFFGKIVRGKAYGISGGAYIGVGAAIIYFALTYKKEKQEVVTFTCYPWDAQEKGENCGLCNEQGLPCSEYQCKSLGQSCSIVNPGTSEEKCVWVNRNDNEFPIIEAWDDALLEGYRYTPDNAVSPPDRGVTVVNDATDGCVKAFTPLKIGITLDEPAKCKIDPERKASFDEMRIFLSGSLLQETHEFQLSLPGSANLGAENITLENDGQYELYVRCADANDNSNLANFVFKYCIEEGPDTTAPLIVSTSILNEMPIKFDQTEVEDFEIYLNEPAECKWSHLDQTYENMEEEFNNCDTSLGDINGQMLYSCETTLTGLNNRGDNKFYFRCKDQPIGIPEEERNTNAESYKFNLIGTEPLFITDASPNGTIKDSTEYVKVEFEVSTSAGHNEGESKCYYSETDSNYNEFYNTNSYTHSQELHLLEGDYNYFIKCIDLGGNEDKREISFRVESDKEAPVIVRAYLEEEKLKLVTNEESTCSYSTVDCTISFDEMISMSTLDNIEHFTPWNTQSDLFIKCQDEYYNLPIGGNVCNLIVRATNIETD